MGNRLLMTRHAASEESVGTSQSSSSSASDLVSPKRPRQAAQVPFSLSALEAEVDSLRKDPPEYITHVGTLSRPSLICRPDGTVGPPEEDGPWDLLVYICGKVGDQAYGHPFRVSLRFSTDLWPMKLAEVRFRCVFHHGLTEDGGGMLSPFYRTLPRDAKGACTVRLVLQHVRGFLVDPVESWTLADGSLDTEITPDRVSESVATHRGINAERWRVIGEYRTMVKYPDLFATPARWLEDWLDPSFKEARRLGTAAAWTGILKEHLAGEIYSFKILTAEFCEQFIAELFNFYGSGLPARRPNSMNAYGIILNDIGMEPLIDALQQMLQPIGELLFPGPGSCWDGHHCFVVRYREGEDLGLDMHTDDSDVTFNICLGLDFKGAGLQFCGMLGAPNHRKQTHTYQHVKGSCVVHLGRKRHGADDITSGERLNLILWNHSSTYRESDEYTKPPYEVEESAPDKVCVSYTHDRDFGNFKEYPAGKEDFRGRGWCPRKKFEYEGFEPDAEEVVQRSS